jgi:hypothetical protein
MEISQENYEIRKRIMGFEQRIEEMHWAFYKFYNRLEPVMPDWERLERELVLYSRRKILDLELSKNLDRVLYKFQNRKKIWLKWAEEVNHIRKAEESEATETADATDQNPQQDGRP